MAPFLFLSFLQAFDADRAIALMMQGPNWPRTDYMNAGRPLTPAEIKERWEKNRQEAAEAGTWTHLQCECVLNGGAIEGSCPEMNLFRSFLGQVPALLAWRTEWAIWGDDEQVAGMIDFVALDMNGHLVLLVVLQ